MHDPRTTAARPDLAARHLEGKVVAARFVDGVTYVVATGIAPMRNAPSPEAELCSQALRGEGFTVYEMRDEWAWGQLAGDSYVGWVPSSTLQIAQAAATHRVVVPRTFAFPQASIKTPPTDMMPLGAKLAIVRTDATFAETDDGLFVPASHVAAMKAPLAADFVQIAEQFVTTPYLWGGKSASGIDCSGLVQVALSAAGIAAPRDSDMQEAALGEALPQSRWGDLKRGDLIFWKGHVAIARDRETIVHANAHHMATAIEETSAAIARIKAAGTDVRTIRRISR